MIKKPKQSMVYFYDLSEICDYVQETCYKDIATAQQERQSFYNFLWDTLDLGSYQDQLTFVDFAHYMGEAQDDYDPLAISFIFNIVENVLDGKTSAYFRI